MKLVLAIALATTTTVASLDAIAGYAPGTDVTEHNSIDLDVKAMSDDGTIDGMYSEYANGGNSLKASRTVKGFSDGGDAKMVKEPYFQMYSSYYEDPKYAHKFVEAAKDGSGVWADADDAARKQGIIKGAVYQNVWMYAIHEFEAGLDKCKLGAGEDNTAAVHAWDEGVAFYTGSLQGTATAPATGVLVHVLADKRCADFGTCVSGSDKSTGSKANVEIYKLFAQGRDLLDAGECHQAIAIKDQAIQKMTIPLVQGTMKYAWYSNSADDIGSDDKALAEAYAFSRAILPLVNKCRRTDAETIATGIDISKNKVTGYEYGNYDDIKAALENNYECLGITCEDVGAYGADTPCDDGLKSEFDYTWTDRGQEDCMFGDNALFIVIGVGALAFVSLVTSLYCWNKKNDAVKQAAAGPNKV